MNKQEQILIVFRSHEDVIVENQWQSSEMWEAFRKGATQYGACDFNYAVDQSELEKMVLFFFL